MKILIDGHNLGLKEPTGVGSFAKNLAQSLISINHEVSILYGINHTNKVWKTNTENINSFYSQLLNIGELPYKSYEKWAFHFFYYVMKIILNQELKPYKIDNFPINEISKSFKNKIPLDSNIYNLPNIFRVSQAFAAIFGNSLPFSYPNDVENFDIFHTTMPLPLKKNIKSKKVVTLHDLIPLKIPRSISINVKLYRKIINASLKDADMIFCSSLQTKKDAIKFLGIKEDKIHVTYMASVIPDKLRKLSDLEIQNVLKKFDLKFQKYFLFYGAIEPKKNVFRLIKAFKNAMTDCKLVIVGKNGSYHKKESEFLDQLDKEKYRKILRIPYLEIEYLVSLIKASKAIIFPSLYEGFGLPVLEAMQLGTPVITSNRGSLSEVGGEAVHLVDPYSISDISNAIEKFSIEKEYLVNLRKKGLIQAEKFNQVEFNKRLSLGYQKLFK